MSDAIKLPEVVVKLRTGAAINGIDRVINGDCFGTLEIYLEKVFIFVLIKLIFSLKINNSEKFNYKVMRTALLFTATVLMSFAAAEEKKSWAYERARMFDKDSEFMKGFETGILVRSKGGSMEEFGCKVVESGHEETLKTVIETISKGLESVSSLSANLGGNVIQNALKMLTEFLTVAIQLINALNPNTELDLYCRGMVFGLHGSTMLVKFANIVLKSRPQVFQPVSADETARTGRKSGWVNPDPVKSALSNIVDHVKGELNKDEKAADL
jgi:hypothetical protein